MSKLSLKAVVLSLSLLLMSANAASPAIANIIAAFPNTNPSTIMWVITLPSIVSVVFSFIYGRLVLTIKKKTLFYLAMVCFVIGGVVPAFLNSITLILVMRGVFGISLGFLMPLATGLIADFFEGQERASMMGLQSAFINLGGMIFQLMGGFLAASGWHHTFYAYLFGIVIVIWVLYKLPEPKRVEQAAMGEGEKIKLPGKLFVILGILSLYNLLFVALFTNASVVIVNNGLGDASSTGIALTFFNVAGLFAALAFGKVTQVLKGFVTPIGWILTGVGYGLVALSHDLNFVFVGCVIAGAGAAVTMPSYFIKVSMASPPAATGLAFAYMGSFTGIAQFVSPMIFGFIAKLVGQELGRFPIAISAVGLLTIGVLLTLSSFRANKIAPGKNLESH